VRRCSRRALAGSHGRHGAPDRPRKGYLNGHYVGRVQPDGRGPLRGRVTSVLTTAFRRTEGVPLHRYLTQLRLAQALVELPHASDLTALALDLGFSSHSHFRRRLPARVCARRRPFATLGDDALAPRLRAVRWTQRRDL
jgi:hypothetical protein